MVWFDWWRWRHTLLLVAATLFLLAYFGLLSWGRIELALEQLAAEGTSTAFSSPIGRGEAIITSFMFLMLSPLAAVTALGLFTFSGAVLSGILRGVIRTQILPDWLFTATAYGALLGAAWYVRETWVPWAREAVALVARALLVAVQ